MSTGPLRSVTPAIDIYIKLAQYPILADRIRERMREELFRRGIIEQEAFEREVREKALESQQREGMANALEQEQANLWQQRLARIRMYQTDAYFANELGITLLEQLIDEVLSNQPGTAVTTRLTFNPEVAPWTLLFAQGELYESLPEAEKTAVLHHLLEIKVVLIKGMISDQLAYIGVAKHFLSIADLRFIYRRRIGSGKIGGKAAGLMLAWKILQESTTSQGESLNDLVDIPDSYFIGSEVIYDFRLRNRLDKMMNQKYLPLEEIRKQHNAIEEAHVAGTLPDEIVNRLREVLIQMGDSPLIVRSSSLLEDNFGHSFAGKYSSYFCPNQGTLEENLEALQTAIKKVYASSLNPDAILYRQRNGLIDYDERMAILLQKIDGKQYGRYFMPTLAGVGFSQNPFRWNRMIRREDGFLRLVLGLGTRAVDRVANDYPRMIALSHPRLRPEATPAAQRQYAQSFIDVIDLEENRFDTVPMSEIVDANFPELRFVASHDQGEYLQRIVSVGSLDDRDRFVLTFDYLTRDKNFIDLMRSVLIWLETKYQTAVDIEYVINIIPSYPYPTYKLTLLQCRPLSQRAEHGEVEIPDDIPESDTLFRASDLIPNGAVMGVRYVILIDPRVYRTISDITIKQELGRAVGRLNKRLEGETFILMGPGRWGSNNLELGVRVSYADIYNCRALVEIGVAQGGVAPELSYGTHFFQDLVESNIYSIPLNLSAPDNWMNWTYTESAPNALASLLPEDAALAPYLQVIDITAVANAQTRLNILMDGQKEVGLAYFVEGEWDTATPAGSLSTF